MNDNTTSHLVIRAESNPEIGTGHFMRSLALAQAWILDGHQVTFITRTNNLGLLNRLSHSGIHLLRLAGDLYGPDDLSITLKCMDTEKAEWLVLDGYEFGTIYQKSVKQAGRRLMVIDDCADQPYYFADLVLNQNFNAANLHYSGEEYTVKLLGTKYVLLRPEFFQWHAWKKSIPLLAHRVLVSMGGGDSLNFSLEIIKALRGITGVTLQVKIVIGAINPHKASLLAEAQQICRHSIEFEEDVVDMSKLMAWADVAICGAGTISWELAYMGLPALLVVMADNQMEVATGWSKTGAVLNLGRYTGMTEGILRDNLLELISGYETRSKMSLIGRSWVDGLGCRRVLDRLQYMSDKGMSCG